MLGIRLIHSRPYRPQGRGKQERLGRYIRERFLLEAEAQGIASFQQLNDRFTAWAEQVCNTRVHAETGQTPIQRFTSHGPLHAVEPFAQPGSARSHPSVDQCCYMDKRRGGTFAASSKCTFIAWVSSVESTG